MISAVTYTGDGATRVFPVAFEIKGENYVVVFIDDVAVNDRTTYDIINNSIVFVEESAPVVSSVIEIVVASSPTEIADLNAPPSTVQTIIDNLADINSVANTVVPNIDEILLSDDNATIATTKALEASTSAGEALASKNLAATSAGEALISKQNANASEGQALIYKNSAKESATTATTKAEEASTKAGEASTSASQALVYRNEAEGFRDEAETFANVVLNKTNIASEIHASTSKTTPVDADELGLIDSASTFTLKKLTWANLKATLKTYLDTLYQVILVSGTNIKTINSNSILGSGDIVVGETAWTANDTRAKTALNASGTAPIYACRAWVNFNGTGTVAILASGNVSSITDGGVGLYECNFLTAMPDLNYSVSKNSNTNGTAPATPCAIEVYSLSSSKFNIATGSSSTFVAYADHSLIALSVFR